MPLYPNLKNFPLQYLAIQILDYSNHGCYFNSSIKTHNNPSTSLYKLRDQKRTGIWKSSIQALMASWKNFNIFGLRPQQESVVVMVDRKNFFATKSVQIRRKYLFYRSITMEATINTSQYKYNLETCEMQSLDFEFKMK